MREQPALAHLELGREAADRQSLEPLGRGEVHGPIQDLGLSRCAFRRHALAFYRLDTHERSCYFACRWADGKSGSAGKRRRALLAYGPNATMGGNSNGGLRAQADR